MAEDRFVTAFRQSAFDYWDFYHQDLIKTAPNEIDPAKLDQLSGFRVSQSIAIMLHWCESFEAPEVTNPEEQTIKDLFRIMTDAFEKAFSNDADIYEKTELEEMPKWDS